MARTRKQLGAWYTPLDLVDAVIEAVVTAEFVAARPRRQLAVLDPACGDGRFLAAAERRIASLGAAASLTGCDLDGAAIGAARAALPSRTELRCADALEVEWPAQRFDLIVGNPPFLSQMAASTTRGGASRRGGGPYADAAAEFLALAGELVDPDGGRVALVLPQSMLASRDAAAIRSSIAERAHMVWSWWSPQRLFDAQIHVCVVAFEFGSGEAPERRSSWSHVVSSRRDVPDVPAGLAVDGTLGQRARLNANFRDEYYGLIPAVGDHRSGPPLVTCGLVDPGRSWWGERPITYAKRRYGQPRVDLARLDDTMRRWAQRRLVPKVLVANQTRVIEAVCDPMGAWLPAVPVLGVYPNGAHWDDEGGASPSSGDLAAAAWDIAAVLTSPLASAWAWHGGAGTGLSPDTVRLSPVSLAALPWPAGDLAPAVAALEHGDVRRCARAVDVAFGLDDDEALFEWWSRSVQRIEARQPTGAPATASTSPTG